ncbi:hypothetical protein ESCAB7627_3233 [Escherichia albertii TW07627]|uniref:Uncharacterized protein n=1 Tax=Escherichia albertii (strain TW07627) TaxID=502347 RepID=A0ABC9NMM1_ESCAT|nr:hypothetical protein ESCAB7627_3233 [Escherichia albertii TW07627]
MTIWSTFFYVFLFHAIFSLRKRFPDNVMRYFYRLMPVKHA